VDFGVALRADPIFRGADAPDDRVGSRGDRLEISWHA
jgi:hypothetical protein